VRRFIDYERGAHNKELQRRRTVMGAPWEQPYDEDNSAPLHYHNKIPRKPMTPSTWLSVLKKKELNRLASKGGTVKNLLNSWSWRRINPNEKLAVQTKEIFDYLKDNKDEMLAKAFHKYEPNETEEPEENQVDESELEAQDADSETQVKGRQKKDKHEI